MAADLAGRNPPSSAIAARYNALPGVQFRPEPVEGSSSVRGRDKLMSQLVFGLSVSTSNRWTRRFVQYAQPAEHVEWALLKGGTTE